MLALKFLGSYIRLYQLEADNPPFSNEGDKSLLRVLD